jgi:hypothetical protein
MNLTRTMSTCMKSGGCSDLGRTQATTHAQLRTEDYVACKSLSPVEASLYFMKAAKAQILRMSHNNIVAQYKPRKPLVHYPA